MPEEQPNDFGVTNTESDPLFRSAFSVGSSVTPNIILRSSNFRSGLSGWSLSPNGQSEFNNDSTNTTKLIDSEASTSGNVGTGQDVLRTFTIPSGVNNEIKKVDDGYRINYRGYTANNANSKGIAVYINSTQIFSIIPGNSAVWSIDLLALASGVVTSTNQIALRSHVTYGASGIFGGSYDISEVVDVAPGASDTIELRAEGVANNDVVCMLSTVELLRKP